GAHLAVIDALMAAFAFEWTKTLPGPLALASLEHKLLFWVDTTIRRLQEKTEQEAAQRASPTAPADGVAPAQTSINLMVLLAELFMCFEVLKPDFVQVKDLPDGHGSLKSSPSMSHVEALGKAWNRQLRAPSPSSLMSPSRLPGSREREWENGSNASSPASVPEYTGPRLYKEPSAKSNKFIIHNALSHCCLAGKVNEPQKNRILEEIEKSKANHFLILFRDSSCQFRALYTPSGETEELSRLTGYGPRT
ncbi:hypothetical protein E2I00_013676, partial [Balaenoptera physalus]